MKMKAAYILMAAAMLAVPATAQKKRNVNDIKTTITDSSIVFPESYEADTQKMLEGWYMQNYTATDSAFRTKEDVPVSDAVLRDRLSKLPTVIDMPFNSIVRSYIERFTKTGRAQVAGLLGLSLYYMPIFEQALEEEGLPLELKYLPVIESALDPNAVSKHGAAGLWQFTVGTGKGMGMEISSLVDERRDPYISSRKAAQFLKKLYESYGDWSLVIAAYNCGPGAVNKAIRRAGGDIGQKDYWAIYNFLSPETRGYVPMFIAANYVMNYHKLHNISPVLPTKPLVTDTVHIGERIHFDQISHVLDIPVEELRVLNPQFRADIIPGNNERLYTLILPSQQINAYLMSQQEIRDYEAEKYARRVVAEPGAEPDPQMAAIIAEEDQRILAADDHNQLDDLPDSKTRQETAVTRDRRGRQQQHLESDDLAQADRDAEKLSNSKWSGNSRKSGSSRSKTNTGSKKKSKKAAAPSSHTVKSGDNLSNIAKKYGTTVSELKKANGIKGDGAMIKPGQKLNIPGKKTANKAKSGSRNKSKNKRRR